MNIEDFVKLYIIIKSAKAVNYRKEYNHMPNIKSNEVKTISDILLDLYSIDDTKELKKTF